MSPLLVVCGHFWPVCNEGSYRLAHFVRFLRDNQIPSEIVTARWHSKWPATSTFQDVRLNRILPAPTSPWNEGFFFRNLWNWIERQAETFDKIYIDNLHLIAHAKLSSGLRQKSFLIRFDAYSHSEVNLLHKPSSTLASLINSDSSRFIVSNAYEHRTLIGAGIDSRKIFRIAPMNVWSPPRTTLSKQQARIALQTISHDFVIPVRMPLIIVFFSGDDYESEHSILKTLTRSLDSQTAFRVWVFGCNDLVRRHYSYLKDFGVHHDILLHSSFDDIDLLFHAADLIICPENRVGKSFYYLEAIATGTPIPWNDNPNSRFDSESEMGFGDYAYAMLNQPLNLDDTIHSFIESPNVFQSMAEQRRNELDWPKLRRESVLAWKRMLQD